MSFTVDNAIILAAGTASRFAPLSREKPKALIEVRGEVLIERQLRQLREAGLDEIALVVGYKREQFAYLTEKFGVRLLENDDYLARNNNGSIHIARDLIRNTYICSSDNYFTQNPFRKRETEPYYAALYAEGETAEWCLTADANGDIDSVTVGGRGAWYMLGHTLWDESFSRRFLAILEREYDRPETVGKLWETIYTEHLDELKLKIRKYPADAIFEFDTLDELRSFDPSYETDTRSEILKALCAAQGWRESELRGLTAFRDGDNSAAGFRFRRETEAYEYRYTDASLQRIEE